MRLSFEDQESFLEVFVLIIPQVIWNLEYLCHPRARRGVKTIKDIDSNLTHNEIYNSISVTGPSTSVHAANSTSLHAGSCPSPSRRNAYISLSLLIEPFLRSAVFQSCLRPFSSLKLDRSYSSNPDSSEAFSYNLCCLLLYYLWGTSFLSLEMCSFSIRVLRNTKNRNAKTQFK